MMRSASAAMADSAMRLTFTFGNSSAPSAPISTWYFACTRCFARAVIASPTRGSDERPIRAILRNVLLITARLLTRGGGPGQRRVRPIPTDKGYRLFVDTLMRLRPPASAEVSELERRFEAHRANLKSLVASTSQVLSAITQMAGVVTVPRTAHPALTQIEFVPLSENRVLAVLVVNGHEVQNRVVQLERYYSGEELRRAANYLSEQFRGRTLAEVRMALVDQLQETRRNMNQIMLDAIQVAQKVFGDPS